MRAAMIQRVAYPNLYLAFILLGAFDILLTTVILSLGGSEVNVIAQRAMDIAGLHGLVSLKFASVIAVVLICEALARRGDRARAASRRLAEWAVAISTIPVAVALVQLAAA